MKKFELNVLLCLTKQHNMENVHITQFILNVATLRTSVVSFTFRSVYRRKNRPRRPLIQWLDCFQSLSSHCEYKENRCPCSESNLDLSVIIFLSSVIMLVSYSCCRTTTNITRDIQLKSTRTHPPFKYSYRMSLRIKFFRIRPNPEQNRILDG